MVKNCIFGISLNEKCKKEEFPDIQLNEFVYFNSENEEEWVSHWSRFDKIDLYIFFLKDIPHIQIQKLKTFIRSDQFKSVIDQKKIELFIFTDEKNKSETLLLFCECKNISNLKINYNIIESNEFKTEKTLKLGLIQLYYDLDSIYEDIDDTKGGFIPRDLVNTIKFQGYIPEKYWYWHEGSCIHWQNVVESPDYLLSKITTELLKNNIDEIVEIIHKKDKNLHYPAIDFIDLGVGTPSKDEIIITALLNKYKNISGTINYYPVDISFPLMEYTLHRILHLKRIYETKQKILGDFKIIPILGDFEKINEPAYRYVLKTNRPKIIAILGNTFGNFEEKKFLQKIIPILQNADGDGYLLIDVEFAHRYQDESSRNELIRQYFNKDMFNFAFHPLELLKDYPKGDPKGDEFEKYLEVSAEYMPEKSHDVEWNFGGGQRKTITDVPSSIVVLLKYKDLDKKLDFSIYDKDRIQEILMIWSTKYNQTEFEKFIMAKDFEKCGFWHDSKMQYGLYLLKYTSKKKEKGKE